MTYNDLFKKYMGEYETYRKFLSEEDALLLVKSHIERDINYKFMSDLDIIEIVLSMLKDDYSDEFRASHNGKSTSTEKSNKETCEKKEKSSSNLGESTVKYNCKEQETTYPYGWLCGDMAGFSSIFGDENEQNKKEQNHNVSSIKKEENPNDTSKGSSNNVADKHSEPAKGKVKEENVEMIGNVKKTVFSNTPECYWFKVEYPGGHYEYKQYNMASSK